ncbi:MAG: 1,5-anhydro-D-fructose reductase [Alphaproteobacteria bacterium ADurb.BinA280]|jgi:predicted dehydrogenase|uniref:Gfo/Idh/MocA family protein n=1 Tax=Casimicrobium huifangae TaxID=2591109 RepID=UPI0009C9002C|nr:Gfo/Idh/MocA family oxidoreductase [Casimicrobium huifangae]OPZ10730.1 MAG: 1,5-anhydro-D-fructose reductase [Alphaproteobacteria bacterium ADurb.BinA280]HOB01407.1 Gfo/Idh/MocA family oxidoreductase [Casimicrobium huifangae]HQA34005.1 Gfo/Idh/MocA family oxidoreductase [Casimicrobium huifangae]HQD64604.1 Gfo/Idh/MocA family oxidoreductase [Casimicrobium huifangae]
MSKTRIAVAGAGLIGRSHINVVQASATVELTAVVDPSPQADAIANAAGVPLYRTLEDLLQQKRPDGIVLATPNQLHVPQALQCIEAGVACLLEKPIAPTVAEAEALVTAADMRGARLLIGHHRAHSPIMAKACAVVQSGQLGRVVGVMGSATFFKPDHYFDDGPWRREVGGGPILINMIHEVHNLRMLCGEVTAVQAIKSHALRGFAVEDTVAISLQFASGALGSFLLSDVAASARSWEHTSQENKAYPTYEDEDCYVISGTDGTLSVPTMRLKTYPRAEDRSWWKPFEVGVVGMVREDPLKRQMEHFGAVVRGEVAPLVSARDGLQNLRVTEAITLAAATGQLVRI